MAIQFMLDILDHAPPMTAAEGLILLAIAEETRVPGEVRTIDVPTMTRRTRGMSPSGVRKAVERLAERGIEVRVPFGVNKRGEPQYAVMGQPPRYRLPSFPPPPGCSCARCEKTGSQKVGPQSPLDEPLSRLGEDSQAAQGGTVVPPDTQGGTTVHKGRTVVSGGGTTVPLSGTTVPPYPSVAVKPPSLSAPERQIVEAAGATAEEAREMIRIITTDNPKIKTLPAYLSRMTENDTLTTLLERVRAGERVTAPQATPTPPTVAERLTQQPCPHGMPGGHHPRPGSGTPACPQCRTGDTPPPPAVRPVPAPAAPRDLSSLRETLGSLTTRSGPRRPALTIRPRTAPETPPEVERAHATLARHGNALDLMDAARKKLGDQAHRNEVVVLAAELAREERPAPAFA